MGRGHASRNAWFDPETLLHQPETGLLAISVEQDLRLLRLDDDTITEIGVVSHPNDDDRPHRRDAGKISRALLVDGALWTVSRVGVAADDPATARRLAWLPSN